MDSNAVIERANRLGFSDSINYRLLCGDIVIYQDGTYKIFPFSVEKEIHKLWKAGLTDSEKEEAKGYISRKIRKEKLLIVSQISCKIKNQMPTNF